MSKKGLIAAVVAMAGMAVASMPTSAGPVTKSYNAATGDAGFSLSSCTADTWQASAPNVNAVCFTVNAGDKAHVAIKDDHSGKAGAQIQFADVAGTTGKQQGTTVVFCDSADVTVPAGSGVMYVYLTASGGQVDYSATVPAASAPCGPGSGNATTGTVTVDGAASAPEASASKVGAAQPTTTAGAAVTVATASMTTATGSPRFQRGYRPL